MGNRTLRDRNGLHLGEIRDDGRELTAYDARGMFVGRYHKDSDTTFDASGMTYGSGNQLAALVREQSG